MINFVNYSQAGKAAMVDLLLVTAPKVLAAFADPSGGLTITEDELRGIAAMSRDYIAQNPSLLAMVSETLESEGIVVGDEDPLDLFYRSMAIKAKIYSRLVGNPVEDIGILHAKAYDPLFHEVEGPTVDVFDGQKTGEIDAEFVDDDAEQNGSEQA